MSIEAALQAIDRERTAWVGLSLDKDFQEALDRIEAALNHTCKWSPLDENCPVCGGRIEEVQQLPDAEEDK